MYQFAQGQPSVVKGFKSWIQSLLLMPSRAFRACNAWVAGMYDTFIRIECLAQQT